MPSLAEFIVWIVIGLIAGTLAGRLATWDRQGFGMWRNLAIGLVGAVIGGFVLRLFGWFDGLAAVSVSLRDIVDALIGSLIVLGGLWIWRRTKGAA